MTTNGSTVPWSKQVSVPRFTSKPINTPAVPPNPYMAPNNYSCMHIDSYQSDAATCAGPLGGNLLLQFMPLPGLCPTLTFNSQGQIITVAIGPADANGQQSRFLLLIDPVKQQILTSLTLPSGGGGGTSFGAGGYIYLDNNENVVVPMVNGTICSYAVSGFQPMGPGGPVGSPSYSFVLGATYTTGMSPAASIQAAMPDYYGNLWFVASDDSNGYVGIAGSGSSPPIIMLIAGETIGNSFAVDETGVYVVSDYALYCLRKRITNVNQGTSTIMPVWRQPYDHGVRMKKGQKNFGSGTTPTLLDVGDEQYVAITDNAAPQMNVVVCRREAGASPRQVGAYPVFKPGMSDTENSLIGAAGTFVVENNYGYVSTIKPADTALPGGLTAVQVTSASSASPALRPVWENDQLYVPSVVSKVSTVTGLIYTYSLKTYGGDNYYRWSITAVDWQTGKEAFNVDAASASSTDHDPYDNHYSAMALNPVNGDLYVPLISGLLTLKQS